MKVDEFASLTPLGDALSQLLDSPEAARKMGLGRAAQKTWFQVNGDIERAHTCGTYVAKPRRAGELPTFVVYTDTRTRAVDFRANREIYLARMAAAGLRFQDIRFQQTKNPPSRKAAGPAPAPAKAAPAPAPLAPAEEARVRQMCAGLPESLREKAYKAMCASMRARKAESRGNGETRP